jgi:hypothetical protein
MQIVVQEAPGACDGGMYFDRQGKSPEQAMRLIEQQRPIADPHAWNLQHQNLEFLQTWKIRK